MILIDSQFRVSPFNVTIESSKKFQVFMGIHRRIKRLADYNFFSLKIKTTRYDRNSSLQRDIVETRF